MRTAPWTLTVLGTVTLHRDGDLPTTSRLTQPRQVALLCYLVLARPRGLHSRDVVMSLLWPDYTEQQGRRALRNAMYGLRQLLGHDALLSVGDGLIGVDPRVVCCDAITLEELASRNDGTPLLPDVQPFQGLHVTGAAPFDRWLSMESHRLTELSAHAQRSHRPSPATRTPSAAQAERRNTGSANSLDAYVMYVRGHYLFLRAASGGAPVDLLQARECFERALVLDPGFAPALAGLANFFAVAARRGILTPFHATFAKAIAYSHDALAIDDTLAIPHVHFGVQALYLHDDWEAAGRAFATAASLEPQYAEGRRFYGVWLGLMNRHDDALREMEAAVLLEPDIPHMLSSLGAARMAAGDLAGAETALRRTLAIDPRHPPARERLLRLLERQERFAECVALREGAPPMADAADFANAWRAHGDTGYRAARQQELQREAAALESRLVERYTPTVNDMFSPPEVRLVAAYAMLGDWKRVRSWQLQSCAARPALAKWFASVPELQQQPGHTSAR